MFFLVFLHIVDPRGRLANSLCFTINCADIFQILFIACLRRYIAGLSSFPGIRQRMIT